jgi:nucleoid-associated protein YgaU
MFDANCTNRQRSDQGGRPVQKTELQLSVRLSLLLAVVCMVFLVIGGSAGADIPPSAPTEYVVEPGDTLWGIASASAGPGEDVRRLVTDIARLSGVDAGSIFPGQVLLVPAG